MSAKIEYNGSTVANIESGRSATLPVQNKKMATNIKVIAESDTKDATVTADEVIKGEVFYGADGRKTGTMPSAAENTPTLTLESDGNGNVSVKYLQMFNTYLPAGETVLGVVAKTFDGTITTRDRDILISFTIDGSDYNGVENMTWLEWVNSEYNRDGFVISNGYFEMSANWQIIDSDDNSQRATDTIVSGGVYSINWGTTN